MPDEIFVSLVKDVVFPPQGSALKTNKFIE